MKNKKIHIKTFGCQMNVYDSERMLEAMKAENYESVKNEENADVILLNTCHIREKAAEKVYSYLGRYKDLKKRKDNLKIGVTGCVAQAEGNQILRRQPLVDVVIGPQSYHRLPQILDETKKGKKVVNIDFPVEDKFNFLPSRSAVKRSVSSYLTVQAGCDKFCSFCVVPYTRGNESSRPVNDILNECKKLVNQGAKEIILLGQNVNAYSSYVNEKKYNLSDLIKEISKKKLLKRVRFTTSHPNDMTDDLIKLFGDEKKLMPYLHLPIQSGSNKILNLMNRKHKVSDYKKIIDKLRNVRNDIAISGDFIVGYPGETDKDFDETLKLCEEIQYAQAFSFKYSKRPGTPASIKDEVDDKIKSERLSLLQSKIFKSQKKFNNKFIDTNIDVLIEKKGKKENQLIGKSPYFQSVVVNGGIENIGSILKVKILSCNTNTLIGSVY